MSTSANSPAGAGTIEQAVHTALAGVDDPEIQRPITELVRTGHLDGLVTALREEGGAPT